MSTSTLPTVGQWLSFIRERRAFMAAAARQVCLGCLAELEWTGQLVSRVGQRDGYTIRVVPTVRIGCKVIQTIEEAVTGQDGETVDVQLTKKVITVTAAGDGCPDCQARMMREEAAVITDAERIDAGWKQAKAAERIVPVVEPVRPTVPGGYVQPLYMTLPPARVEWTPSGKRQAYIDMAAMVIDMPRGAKPSEADMAKRPAKPAPRWKPTVHHGRQSHETVGEDGLIRSRYQRCPSPHTATAEPVRPILPNVLWLAHAATMQVTDIIERLAQMEEA